MMCYSQLTRLHGHHVGIADDKVSNGKITLLQDASTMYDFE